MELQKQMLGEILNQEDLVFRLRKRAEIRRSVEEAANEIDSLRKKLSHVYNSIYDDGK